MASKAEDSGFEEVEDLDSSPSPSGSETSDATVTCRTKAPAEASFPTQGAEKVYTGVRYKLHCGRIAVLSWEWHAFLTALLSLQKSSRPVTQKHAPQSALL